MCDTLLYGAYLFHVYSLMEACISGNTECAALLIRYGAKWYLESRVGMTAIHYAALDGNTELVTILLNAGVPVSLKTSITMLMVHVFFLSALN